ncbi:hypothetical protein ACHAXT_005181 [Thalassiosira profunda]
MAATIKDVIEDVLVQVIKAPRPVDADLLQRMARQLEGARRAILQLGGDDEEDNEGATKLQAIADQLVATPNAGGVAKGPNVSDSAAGRSSEPPKQADDTASGAAGEPLEDSSSLDDPTADSVGVGKSTKGAATAEEPFDHVAKAGELIDAILDLERDEVLGRETVEAKLRTNISHLEAASSANKGGSTAAALKDALEDVLQVLGTHGRVDAARRKEIAHRLGRAVEAGGARRGPRAKKSPKASSTRPEVEVLEAPPSGRRLELAGFPDEQTDILPSVANAGEGEVFDTGILGAESVADSSVAEAAQDRQLQAGYVDCVDGYVSGSTQTCVDACGVDATGYPLCCGYKPSGIVYDSCEYFTGTVYKDGSCNDWLACRSANIPIVKGGSCVGAGACYAPTSLQDVVNSAISSLSAYLEDEKNTDAAKALNFLEKIADTSTPFQTIRDAVTASEALGCPDVEPDFDEACEQIAQVINLYTNQIA